MIKVDVITGFLGSGKTTFIRNLMKSKAWADEKWAVVVNEFGKVGIDGSFLESVSDVSVVEISNGCLCCTLKGDFLEALRKLAVEHKPDRILIEPSGIFVLADLSDLFEQPVLSDVCRLHAVVAIVDPRQFLSQRMKYNYFLESQIRHASILVLSKIEECGEQIAFQALEGLKALNGEAVLLAEPWEDFDFPWFRALLDDAVYLPPTSPAGSEKNATPPHGDEIDIQSFGLTNVRDYTASQFHVMLDGMRRGLYGEVLRVKGYLRIDGVMREVNYSEGDDPAKESSHPLRAILPGAVPAEPMTVPAEPMTVPAEPMTVPAEPMTVPVEPMTVPFEPMTVPAGLTRPSAEKVSDIVPDDLRVERSKISVIGGRLHYGMLTKAFWRIPEPGTAQVK